jgi:hypothetical protein
MKKETELKKLEDILGRVLSQGVPMTILTDPDKSTYTPDEASKIALDAYLMCLCDVQDFLEGNPSGLNELLTEDGKLAAIDTQQGLFVFPVPKEDVVIRGSEAEVKE